MVKEVVMVAVVVKVVVVKVVVMTVARCTEKTGMPS